MKTLNQIIKESIRKTLREFEDYGEENRSINFLDELYNIKTFINQAIQETEKGKFGSNLAQTYIHCKKFIDLYNELSKNSYKLGESKNKMVKETYDVQEPYSFETDREERWYQVGYNSGVDAVVEWLKNHINDYLVKGRDIDLMFDDIKEL